MAIYCMAFNATFNNIAVISWRSVLSLEETDYPEKATELSQVTDNVVSSTHCLSGIQTHDVVIGTDCIGIHKFIYHMITITMTSQVYGITATFCSAQFLITVVLLYFCQLN